VEGDREEQDPVEGSTPKQSAGILFFRHRDGVLEVLLVHPGGPFWAKKDRGAWSIPKGEYAAAEDPLEAAKREVAEEIGFVPDGEFLDLGSIRQAGGKVVRAWGIRGDFDPSRLKSNTFTIEWPPKSGRKESFPEVDRALWLQLEEAREKIVPGQAPLLDTLSRAVGG
jgi:predicted NUDIX family NTP pyrophosphohydrolase